MKNIFIWISIILPACLHGQNLTSGISSMTDLGFPKTKGRAEFDATLQQWKIISAGQYADLNREEAMYCYRKMGGDFLLTGEFRFADSSDPVMKRTGWMVRESVSEDAAHVAAFRQGDGKMVMQYRKLRGAFIRTPDDRHIYPKRGMQTIQLERKAKTFIMRVAFPGEPLQEVGQATLAEMPDSVTVGIFMSSQDQSRPDSAYVWNLRIDKPIPDRYHPDPIIHRTLDKKEPELGSRLEVIDVQTGKRRIIHESSKRFQSPNWMPDGKNLLFNQHGKLFTTNIETGQIDELTTGSVDRINNNHCISFDGKQIAFSSFYSSSAASGSALYIVPMTGGEPKKLSGQIPSYCHGWTPDGKHLLVVGQRNGFSAFNIYQVEVRTGKEKDLTGFINGHADGPECTPDGRYIYFNANTSGTMQIWRMRPDGSEKEQVSFDEYNNWFPHISPDGKWIAFISFPTDVDPLSLPSYKKVMLRIMPAAGGAPRVLAHVFGGQGTFNVHSWSPDSRGIAFVSNSE